MNHHITSFKFANPAYASSLYDWRREFERALQAVIPVADVDPFRYGFSVADTVPVKENTR